MKTLSQHTGVSGAYICRIEAGERTPSRKLLETLAQVLIGQGDQAARDELLLAAGFTPARFRNLMGAQDVTDAFQRSLATDPNDFRAYIGLVMTLIRSGEQLAARQKIQAGLQSFHHMVQLQVLLAALELSKHHFSQAVHFQSEALKAFEREPDPQLKRQDLLWTLGQIYAEQACSLIQSRKRPGSGPEQDAEPLPPAFGSALEAFEQALALAPEDVHLLDEIAHLHYTAGDWTPPGQALQHWRQAIAAWEKVVTADAKLELGYHHLLRNTALLALLYSRTGQFEQAWFTLSLVEACLPKFWLVHYVKACHYGLMILQETKEERPIANEDYFTKALQALAAAIAIDEPDNLARQQAKTEPALEALRRYCPQDYTRIMGAGTGKSP